MTSMSSIAVNGITEELLAAGGSRIHQLSDRITQAFPSNSISPLYSVPIPCPGRAGGVTTPQISKSDTLTRVGQAVRPIRSRWMGSGLRS